MNASRGLRLGLTVATLAAVALAVSFVARDRGSQGGGAITERTEGMTAPDTVGSDAGPVVAGRMVDRLQLFRQGSGAGEVVLDGATLTALLRHAVPGVIPPGVVDPVVRIVDGEVRLGARVSADLLPGGGHLQEALEHLPDSVSVELRGRLDASGQGVTYLVDRVTVAGVPVPQVVVTRVLAAVQERLSGAGTPLEVAGDATPYLAVAWPVDRGRISVSGNRLVIQRAEPSAVRSVDGSDGA